MRQTSCAMNAYQSSCACTLSEPIEPPGGPARHRAYLIRVQNHFIKFGSAAVVNCSRERGGVKLRRLAANQVLSFTLPFEAKSHPRAPPSAPTLAGFAHFSVGDFTFSGPLPAQPQSEMGRSGLHGSQSARAHRQGELHDERGRLS